jgi:hypothetical protein
MLSKPAVWLVPRISLVKELAHLERLVHRNLVAHMLLGSVALRSAFATLSSSSYTRVQ